jgi:hypothetical protein
MPAIGPIKRKDLIACLRQLGFDPRYPAAITNTCRVAEESFGYRILTPRVLVADCWCESFDRPASVGRSGKSFDVVIGMADTPE